ncbi:UDP-4-amino-4,6-dideoxy-N-acetyl-beta-L-altrosamine transaminase [Ruminiclostridium sufflavum DSM 19573]|uniref:UDP-4-amino-4, 6-dideoxy-N-acetyl-beta-L-altrosamine transaminase n=1 Tax=Ruminiclostridium sufflavum DSM 19573 TaxID=1121337 RepID=A0A318XPY3_9FIRM|nr:UDP-4-amino-4,6-dideoxy-N-acetyl-beta-L-altrosamine transaminase [Ruminiclostridium sufflavum]PYG89125.1 UDP-4-amino-4,6-dideoxy-N-acetyl-beta-L-altrosamine transaminase [Ruminiclostridium sufflavum DSM 19573]
MNKLIPYGRQWIDDEDIKAVVDVLKSDYLTTGPKVSEFEERLAEYTGAKYAVAFSNGTSALHGACFAAGISEGDEVITTPITFAASANCALYVGALPVFADICSDTYNIDPSDIADKITSRTKAIIPVDFTGQPCDLDRIMEIAKKYNLIVIEDAAHSIGATYKGRNIGSIADMTTFSFHPVKTITTGEGGAVTTNSRKLYEKLILFRSHGITRDENKLVNVQEGPWFYEQQFLGYNYRLTDIQAALGISQLKKLDKFVRLRRGLARQYNEAFKNEEGLILPYQNAEGNSAWHIYAVQLNTEKIRIGRKEFFMELQEQGIRANVHYIPVYYHPYYKMLGYKKGICPNAEALYERILTLPLFAKLEQGEIEYVIENTRAIINKNKN